VSCKFVCKAEKIKNVCRRVFGMKVGETDMQCMLSFRRQRLERWLVPIFNVVGAP
jgi:hypothetical protein